MGVLYLFEPLNPFGLSHLYLIWCWWSLTGLERGYIWEFVGILFLEEGLFQPEKHIVLHIDKFIYLLSKHHHFFIPNSLLCLINHFPACFVFYFNILVTSWLQDFPEFHFGRLIFSPLEWIRRALRHSLLFSFLPSKYERHGHSFDYVSYHYFCQALGKGTLALYELPW